MTAQEKYERIATLERVNRRLRGLLKIQNDTVWDLNEDIKDFKKRIENLEWELGDLDENYEGLQEELEWAKEDTQRTYEDYLLEKEKAEEQDSTINELQRKVYDLQDELDELRRKSS